jgi:hypothetical protein
MNIGSLMTPKLLPLLSLMFPGNYGTQIGQVAQSHNGWPLNQQQWLRSPSLG